MAYTIKHTDTTKTPKIVEGATVDNSTGLNLIGKNYSNHGTAMNENLLHLLENFASGTAPAQPVEGQLYFDSTNDELTYFDGIDTQGNWKPVSSMTVDATEPSGVGEKS